MNKYRLFAAVGDIDDAFITRAADDTRLKTEFAARKKRRRRVAALVAACLAVAFVGAVYVQIDLNYFVASCGSSLGTLVDGVYYYRDINAGFYAFDPATGESELLISELFHDLDSARINDYGIYYRTGGRRNLVVRVHETGETKTLYKASPSEWTHTNIYELYEDKVIFTLYNKELEHRTVLVLDARTGEVLETLQNLQSYQDRSLTVPYPVGSRNIAWQHDMEISDHYLVENGRPILVNGHKLSLGGEYTLNTYAGESLIAHFYRMPGDEIDLPNLNYVLIRPNGENILIPNGFAVVGGTDDYLFGHLPNALTTHTSRPLYAYRIETGETFALIPDYEMQALTTDGTYLYATAPWSSHTDVYRLDYQADGTLSGVTLVDTIGE